MRSALAAMLIASVAALTACGDQGAPGPSASNASVAGIPATLQPDNVDPSVGARASIGVGAVSSTAQPLEARFDGFGPLRLGMSTREAVQAWPGLYADRPQQIDAHGCDFAQVPGGLSYFALMFDGGRFVRYGGQNDEIAAPGGGQRGMREAQLRALYHDALQEAPDRFAPGGKLLSIEASGVAPAKLVFVLRPDGMVNEWHVGLHPQVNYDEGCENARPL